MVKFLKKSNTKVGKKTNTVKVFCNYFSPFKLYYMNFLLFFGVL